MLSQPGPHTPRTPSRRGPCIRVPTTPQPLGEERQHPRSPPPNPSHPPFSHILTFSVHTHRGRRPHFPSRGPPRPQAPHTPTSNSSAAAAMAHGDGGGGLLSSPPPPHHRLPLCPPAPAPPPPAAAASAPPPPAGNRLAPGGHRRTQLPAPPRSRPPSPALPRPPPIARSHPRPPPTLPLAQRHGAAGALGAEARPPGRRRGAFLQVKPFLRGCAAGDGVGRGKGSWAALGLCSHSGAEAAPSTPCSPPPTPPRRPAVIAGGLSGLFLAASVFCTGLSRLYSSFCVGFSSKS